MAMSRYIFLKTISGQKRFPLVLMLEPLHACNLRCSGCGRIREYVDSMNKQMTLAECLDSVRECNAPIVSICGGEPLLYRELPQLVDAILKQKKHIYLCTNGVILEEYVDTLQKIRNKYLKQRLFLNVHLDGPEEIHDRIVERSGVFQKAINGIKRAKEAGFPVYTNTTLYHGTNIDSLLSLADTLLSCHVDGLMISPAFHYSSVDTIPIKDSLNSTQSEPELFLNREEINKIFREIRSQMQKYPLTATPDFLDFLCGELSLTCAAWANPTRNIRGWRSPCYLIADHHYATYQELLKKTDWEHIGPEHDVRCQNCLTHCGFEPASVLHRGGLRKLLRLIRWEMS